MKLRLRYSLQLTLAAALLLLASCGNKSNKVNSSGLSGTSTLFTSNNPALAANPMFVTYYNQIRGAVPCQNGGARLQTDVTYFTQGSSYSATMVSGNWQVGSVSGGTISNMYVGASLWGDLMFLTKVTAGSQVLGYNVTLSFCSQKTQAGYPYISDDRPLDSFQAPYGIYLDTSTACGYNLIALAQNTLMISRRSSMYPNYTSDAWVQTSFTKPSCR